MKIFYFLGIDAAKHKIRAALSDDSEGVLFEKDLPVNMTGLSELLAKIKKQVKEPEQLLHNSQSLSPSLSLDSR